MPSDIRALFDAAGRNIDNEMRCEVLEWIADPEHMWSTNASGPVDNARHARNACRLAQDDITPEIAASKLGGQAFRFEIDGDAITAFARSRDVEVPFCCVTNGSLTRLGDSGYFAARYRLAYVERSMITIVPPGGMGSSDTWQYHRGQLAPPLPVETPIGKWKGQMLQRELPSSALGETRKLMIYLPPGYSETRSWPALFMTDAGAVEFAGLVEAMIEAHEIEPIVIVSADSGGTSVVGAAPTEFGDLRAADYLPGTPRGAARFDPHMKFFSEELVSFAVNTFHVSSDPAQRAVAGKSNGAVFALWAGIRKPDVFGSAVVMSPGWKPVERDALTGETRTHFFLSAGLYEGPFMMSAQNSEAALKAGGYDVEAHYYVAGHMHDQWSVALRQALLKIFPAG